MTWDPSIPPRLIIPQAENVRREWEAWANLATGEELLRRNGQPTGYSLTRRIRDYAWEGEVAWNVNNLDSSTGVAEAFWMHQQALYLARTRPLDYVMTDAERADFRTWNAASTRNYGAYVLPWSEYNMAIIVRGGALDMASGLRGVAEQDLPLFWAWRATRAAEPEPFVPPADGSLDVRDPRLRHLWVKAAEVARSESMCGSYDKIATEVGVPTRETLRRTGELKPQVRITWNTYFRRVFDRTEGYREIDKKTTGADLKQWIAEMSDEQVRQMFTISDASNLD